MRVNASLGADTEAPREMHLTGRGEVEASALLEHRANHRRMGHGLQRVVKVDTRQRGAQLSELDANPLAVENEERRAELTHQPPHLRRLERIHVAHTVRSVHFLLQR
jgi:hypothetical protein